MTKEKQGKQSQLLNHRLEATEVVTCTLDSEGHCITCSDEAIQVLVLNVDEEHGLARVTFNGVEEEVDVTLVDQIVPGDILLAHGGVAIARVDEKSNA